MATGASLRLKGNGKCAVSKQLHLNQLGFRLWCLVNLIYPKSHILTTHHTCPKFWTSVLLLVDVSKTFWTSGKQCRLLSDAAYCGRFMWVFVGRAHVSEGTFSHVEAIFIFQRITKTCLFKYIENFTTKKWTFSDNIFWYFSYVCSKHRLWVLVRTASLRRF